MSVKSLPIPDKSHGKHVREASSDGGAVIPLQLRRSSRLRWLKTVSRTYQDLDFDGSLL